MDTLFNILQHAQGLALTVLFIMLFGFFMAAVFAPDETERIAAEHKPVRVNTFNQDV